MNANTKKTVLLLFVTLIALMLPALAAAEVTETRAPVAEDLELRTFREIAVEGQLIATDPDGSSLDFQIIRAPRKGEVVLDSESGRFTYYPRAGQRGRDLFTFVAVDIDGNISKEATVRLQIERQTTNVVYSDMQGHVAHVAALELAERGLFVGAQVGNQQLFSPDTLVTRGEFLAMVMHLTESELLLGVRRTGFADDDAIAYWLKPYVSTAVLDGIIQGKPSEEGIMFSPNAYITKGEAAVMISSILGVEDIEVSGLLPAAYDPNWAGHAMYHLTTWGIIPFSYVDVNSQNLNRAEVAKILLATAEILEERSSPGMSLLAWVV